MSDKCDFILSLFVLKWVAILQLNGNAVTAHFYRRRINANKAQPVIRLNRELAEFHSGFYVFFVICASVCVPLFLFWAVFHFLLYFEDGRSVLATAYPILSDMPNINQHFTTFICNVFNYWKSQNRFILPFFHRRYALSF